MSLTRKIAHNTIAQIGGKVISTALGLVAIAMMTRYLGTEQFGWYVTAISFLQFVGILIDFGLIPVTAQMLSEPAFDKEALLKNLLGFRFATAVVFLGFAPLIALLFPYPAPVKIAITFSTLSFLSIAINQVLMGYYQTTLRTHVQALSEVVGRIILVAGLYILVSAHATFLPIMWLIVAATVAQTAILWVYVAKRTPIGFAYDRTIWRAIAVKMWPIAISIVFNVVYLKGDIVLLSIFRPQEDVGLYGAAYRVLDILSQLGMMMMGVMLPLLAYAWSRGMHEEFRNRYQQAFDALMAFGLPMMAGTLLLGTDVITLIAGDTFAAAGPVLQLLGVAVFGVYLGAIFGHVAVAVGRQKETMWVYMSDAVLTFAGYLFFIPRFGMLGAAWMTVFSELYAGVFLYLTVRRYTHERLRFNKTLLLALSTLLMSAVIYLLRGSSLFLIVPTAVFVYAVALYATRAVSKETIREVLSRPTL